MNHCVLVGHVTRVITNRESNGKALLAFVLRTERRFTDRNGTHRIADTDHTTVCWGNVAEAVAKWLKPGCRVIVSGSYESRLDPDRHELSAATVGLVRDADPATNQEEKAS